MKPLVYGITTMGWSGWRECVQSWHNTASDEYPWIIAANKPIPLGFQMIYESTTEPIIAYIHDDLVIHEQGWDQRVLRQFEDPSVGLVGFAGGLGHGQPWMYHEPYRIPNLVRRSFISNLRDAERHGIRHPEDSDAVVLDGLALFVRRSVLDTWGGWPLDKPVSYFMYSENLCCEVRRQGLRIRLVGVECQHLGGKSSGAPLLYSYEDEHAYFYEHNRDVMPASVTR